MNKKFLPLLLSFSILSASCSSIVSKSDYSVVVNSSPIGAEYSIINKTGNVVSKGVTPATVTLKASDGYFSGEKYTIKLKKSGFSDKTHVMDTNLDGWFFGNLLFGGVIGMLIIDPITGAMYKLPERVDISLDSKSSLEVNDEIEYKLIDSLTDEEKARLVLLF